MSWLIRPVAACASGHCWGYRDAQSALDQSHDRKPCTSFLHDRGREAGIGAEVENGIVQSRRGDPGEGVRLVLLNKGGASREDAEVAIRAILDQHWS